MLLRWKLDRYDEAEQAYRKSLELDASYAGVWAELGVLLHWKLDRYDEAEQAYRKSLELDASSVLVWRQLGTLLHWKLDRYDEAEQALRKAIELDETYACAWAELGMLLRWKLDRYDEAEQTLRKALELKPSLACAQGELTALLLTDSARLDEALDLAEQCLENAGRSAESLNSMAWAVFDSDVDDLSLAEAWANEAVQKSPRDLKCLHTLASIQGRGGRWLEALQTAKRFLVDADAVGAVTSDVVDLFVTAAANAYADESLAAIRNSPSSGVLEPLVVGLRMYLGEEVSVAKEIEEVAEDIVKRIREQEKGNELIPILLIFANICRNHVFHCRVEAFNQAIAARVVGIGEDRVNLPCFFDLVNESRAKDRTAI
jgi:tetratricopeptide (TPR) repeat protein